MYVERRFRCTPSNKSSLICENLQPVIFRILSASRKWECIAGGGDRGAGLKGFACLHSVVSGNFEALCTYSFEFL